MWKIWCVPRTTSNYSRQHQANQNLKLTHIYALGGELQSEGVGSLSHCFTSSTILVPWQQPKKKKKKNRK